MAIHDTRDVSPDEVNSAWLALAGRDDRSRAVGVSVLASFDPHQFRVSGYASPNFSSVVRVERHGSQIMLGAPQDPTGMKMLLENVPRLAALAGRLHPGSESHVLLAADELLAGVMESARDIQDPTVYGYAVMGRRLLFDEMLRLDPPPITPAQIEQRRDLYASLSRDPWLRPAHVP